MDELEKPRVLVTWGSSRGGTEGIGRLVAEALEHEGYSVDARPARDVGDVSSFGAVIVGGALYANRWHRDARRFVARHEGALRRVPVWLFSSGPLDASADTQNLPAPRQVHALKERIGARDHVTFGGRLLVDAQGFPAAAMAKTNSGDWRNPNRIRAWARELARELPTAEAGRAVEHPAHSLGVWVGLGTLGWAACAAATAVLLGVVSPSSAIVLRDLVALAVFTALAVRYFRPLGAREPLATATLWTALMGALDAITLVALSQRSLLASVGTWSALPVVFFGVWVMGAVMSTMPWPRGQKSRGDHGVPVSVGRT